MPLAVDLVVSILAGVTVARAARRLVREIRSTSSPWIGIGRIGWGSSGPPTAAWREAIARLEAWEAAGRPGL
jgi:hypothetical protein